MGAALRRFAAVLALGLAAGGCGAEADSGSEPVASGAAGAPAYGDTFIEAMTGDISGLIPIVTKDSSSWAVGDLIYNGLVDRDKDLAIVPELARSWTFSPNCLDLEFKLRRDVKWHDGQPFTAADVVFTYETMVNPRTPTSYREAFLQVERLEAPDPYTVRVRYKAPYAKALESWGSIAILPRHLLRDAMQAGRLREAPQNRTSPVGTGPYRFQEWSPGAKIVLVANPDYFDGRPYLSRVVYRVIPSQATTFLELKAKGVDAAALTALQYVRQTNYPAFRKAYNRYDFPANGYTYLGFNLKDPRFADRRVRQAFAHAVNKQQIIDGVLLGRGRPATGPFKPGTWPADPDVRPYAYDPARARRLLAEAGWRERNADGLLTKDGKPFTFELLTNQGNDERKKVAEIIQASLGELGIGVEIRVIEWAALIKQYIDTRRFEALVLGWGIGTDPDQYNVWHSSKTAPMELNFISYRNPEVDALLEQGRRRCVQADRVETYRRLHRILAEDQPIVFLYFRDELWAVSSRVRGIEASPNGIRHNFLRWYVPKDLQRYTSG